MAYNGHIELSVVIIAPVLSSPGIKVLLLEDGSLPSTDINNTSTLISFAKNLIFDYTHLDKNWVNPISCPPVDLIEGFDTISLPFACMIPEETVLCMGAKWYDLVEIYKSGWREDTLAILESSLKEIMK